MKAITPHRSNLGLALYLLGLAIATYLTAGSVWADLEAVQFDPAIRAQALLEGMRCPILLTEADQEAITLSLPNLQDKPNERPIRVRITEGTVILVHEFTERILLEPNETKLLTYPIAASDAAWGRFVLARIYAFADYPLPAMAATCGVWVFHTGLVTGQALLIGLIAISLLSMAGGGWLWARSGRLNHEEKNFSLGMGALTLVVYAALAAGLAGNWLVGGALLIVSVLLALTLLNRFWK
ncbi:MAG: hypothetical protein HYZ26_03485 [Chloroflexi bacterium]|nr:hypothetical protein [Chloroflexota bacterium]